MSNYFDLLFEVVITSDKGGGICDCPRCLSVCLLARLLKNACMDFDEIFACRQMSGRGRTNQRLSPIRIIVRMPEPSESRRSVEIGQTGTSLSHSEQATGHGMHCKEILFTPRCSPRAREFPGSVDFSVRRMVAELRGIKLAQFSDFALCRRYMRSTECPSSSLCAHLSYVISPSLKKPTLDEDEFSNSTNFQPLSYQK